MADDDYTPDFQTPGQIAANRAYAKALMERGVDPGSSNVISNGIAYSSKFSPLVSALQGFYGRQQMNAAGAQEQRRQNEPVASMLQEPIPGEPQYGINPRGSPGQPRMGATAYTDENGQTKGSWFGNFKGQNNWRDDSDSGLQASGVPTSVPGIALPNRGTLGQLFDVTTPDGRTFTVRQTDLGPAKWTGRGVDVNSAAAEQMGYTPKNFPTDGRFTVRPHQNTQAGIMGTGGQALQFDGTPAAASQGGNDAQSAITMALQRPAMRPAGPGQPSLNVPGRVPGGDDTGDAGAPPPGSFFPQRQHVSRETMGKMMTGDVDPGLRQYMGNSYFGQYQPVEMRAPFGGTYVQDAQGNVRYIPPQPQMQHTTVNGISVERPFYVDPTERQHIIGGGGGPVRQGPNAAGANVPSSKGYDIGGGNNDIATPAPKPQSQAEPEGAPTKVASLETGTATDAGGPLAYAPPTAAAALANKPPTVKTAQATQDDSGSYSGMTDQQLTNIGQKQELAKERSKHDLQQYYDQLTKIQNTARDARTSTPQLELAQKLFKDPKLIQGPWSDWRSAYNRFWAGLTGDQQAMTKEGLSNEVDKLVASGVLGTMRQTLGGLGQIRLAEIQLLNKASASRYNTPEANAAILFLAQRLAQRATDLGTITDDYDRGTRWDSDGRRLKDNADDIPTYSGQNAAINTYMRKHPTLTDDEEGDIVHMLNTAPHTTRPKAKAASMPQGTTADEIKAELARRGRAAAPAQ